MGEPSPFLGAGETPFVYSRGLGQPAGQPAGPASRPAVAAFPFVFAIAVVFAAAVVFFRWRLGLFLFLRGYGNLQLMT